MEDRTGELLQLSVSLKDGLDQKIEAIKYPPEFKHNPNTEFDKLRKRLNYLMKDTKTSTTFGTKKASGKDSIEKDKAVGMKNVEIDPRFYKEDEKRRIEQKEQRRGSIGSVIGSQIS